MKPYSKDLRLRVLATVDRGTPRKEVAKTFLWSGPLPVRVQQEAGAPRNPRSVAATSSRPCCALARTRFASARRGGYG
jgi:hypothetical protein